MTYGYSEKYVVGDLKKTCHCCRERKLEGTYYKIPSNPLYQRFVCDKCFGNARDPFVKELLKELQKADSQSKHAESQMAAL
jgi:hypothetical protein